MEHTDVIDFDDWSMLVEQEITLESVAIQLSGLHSRMVGKPYYYFKPDYEHVGMLVFEDYVSDELFEKFFRLMSLIARRGEAIIGKSTDIDDAFGEVVRLAEEELNIVKAKQAEYLKAIAP